MPIKNKIALITGGASGLGLTYAKELLRNGLKGVTLGDIDVVKGQEAIKDIAREFGENKALFVKLDVVNKNEFEDAMKKTVETFGHFDILVNNAGILNDSIWEKEIDINLKGTINGSILALEEYLPKYKSDSSEPIIVNIASTAGLSPFFATPVYCATKHGVIGLSRTLAVEENYNSQKVVVLTICPGATDTPIFEAVETKSFTPRHSKAFKTALDEISKTIQSPEDAAAGLIKVIENGKNGSIWVIDEGETYEVEVPCLKDLKIIRRL